MSAQDPPHRPSEIHDPTSNYHPPLSGGIIFVIVLVSAAVVGIVGFYIWHLFRERRLGPSTRNYPARGGPIGWLQGKLRSRGYRKAGGFGRERARGGGGAGGLDDDVWNTRLGNEADDFGPTRYDEEVGLHGGSGNVAPYGPGGYSHVDTGYGPHTTLDDVSGNKSGQKELDDRYDEETRGRNPFDERQGAERSDYHHQPYRNLSPTPHDDHHGDSPTERRSMFREGI